MRFLVKSFFEGLLVVVPVAITAYVTWSIAVALDGILGIEGTFGPGLLIVIALVTAAGAITSNVLGSKLVGLFERVLDRIPVVKLIYKAVKDLISAFAGEKKSFDKPALVTLLPGGSAKAMGFITRESAENVGLADHMAVYMPHSYAFAGQVLLFPSDQVTPVDVNPADFMALIVSGGVSG